VNQQHEVLVQLALDAVQALALRDEMLAHKGRELRLKPGFAAIYCINGCCIED
jgi:stage V sporulation protein SpoVS